MAEMVGVSEAEVDGYRAQFERAVLVALTGWTLEYIDALGAADAAQVLHTLSAIKTKQAGQKLQLT